MKIYKLSLEIQPSQIILIPEDAEIMDIQMQHGNPVMWFLANPKSKQIEVKINIYETGHSVNDSECTDVYLATIQYEYSIWHFFMNYEN